MSRLPPNGSRLLGVIHRYNPEHGFGFIRNTEVGERDVYFQRFQLPVDAQDFSRAEMTGRRVEFELMVTPEGKLRAEQLWFVAPLERERAPRGFGERGSRRGGGGSSDQPPPPLDENTVVAMIRFLEEKGGAMDHGKFANAFPGVKKSQLEPHFVLVPEGSNSGGRWQVTLPGVEPMTPEERIERERLEAAENEAIPPSREPRADEPLELQPSRTLRLIGCVKKWDRKRGYGFVIADGVDDVFVHRNDLPHEVRNWKGNFEGVEVTFVLGTSEDGKFKAVDVNLILTPDEKGTWQLRRAELPVGDEAAVDKGVEQGVEAGAVEGLAEEAVEEEEEIVDEEETAAAPGA